MKAKDLYKYLLNAGGSTLADGSRAEKTLIRNKLAYLTSDGKILKVCKFSGVQSYETALKEAANINKMIHQLI